MIDGALGLELLLVLGLVLLNGVFAMSELAVVSARKARLQQRAEAGDRGAARALELAQHPTRFLSTVQIGITLIGVLAGAYGGASIAAQLDRYLETIPALAAWSEELALALVVGAITFLSLLLGELVPKRIALEHPERIAARVAGPMHRLSRLASPLVAFLGAATEGVLRVIGLRRTSEPPVTEDELSALLAAGTAAGVFEPAEHELVERVFSLGDRRVGELALPRHRIGWLDARDDTAAHREELIRQRLSQYLVCDGDVDQVLGMVRVKDLLVELLEGRPLDLQAALRKPLFVPATLPALRLLEMFRESGVHLAVVIDEFGGVDGLVTMNDVLDEITGGLTETGDASMVQRPDGSWLVAGSVPLDEFREQLGLPERGTGPRAGYTTVAGLVVATLGRIPQTGSTCEAAGLRFEVVDMDGRRVDRILVTPAPVPDGDAVRTG